MLVVRAPDLGDAISRVFKAWRTEFQWIETLRAPLRGYSPFGSEQALLAPMPDPKSFFDFIPGMKGSDYLLSPICEVHARLLSILRRNSQAIAYGIAPKIASQLETLLERTLPPILRLTHYPAQHAFGVVNHPHADMDLVTLLSAATVAGLQVALHNYWFAIENEADTVTVLGGELLELIGGPSAEIHRVMCGQERLSISFFVNAPPDHRLPDGRLAEAVLTDRLQRIHRVPKPET